MVIDEQLHLNLADLIAQHHVGHCVIRQENVDGGGYGFAVAGSNGLAESRLAGYNLGAAVIGDDGFQIAVGDGDSLCPIILHGKL